MSEAIGETREIGWRGVLPAVALGLWLAAFWVLSPHPVQCCLLGLLVVPSLLLVPRPRLREALRSRWLAAAAVLLGWQTLSRLWSGGGNASPGWWLDALLVFGLLCALLAVAPGRVLGEVVFPSLAIVSGATSLVSLIAFYAPPTRHPAGNRLQNVFIHEYGLNPVPTGFLFAFGSLIAAWWLIAAARRETRAPQVVALVLSLLGLFASQSRGPMLLFVVGLCCLLVFGRKRALPALWLALGTAAAFFGFLLLSGAGRDAALNLLERGSTGRFDIYRWFLDQMSVRDVFVGTGMARRPIMPADNVGWAANHPHSIYLTQLYQTGLVGLSLLLGLIAGGLRAALALARGGEPLWLSLLAGACVGLLFDGAQVFTVWSPARVEILLIVVPAAIAIGRARSLRDGETEPMPKQERRLQPA